MPLAIGVFDASKYPGVVPTNVDGVDVDDPFTHDPVAFIIGATCLISGAKVGFTSAADLPKSHTPPLNFEFTPCLIANIISIIIKYLRL